MGEKSTYYAVIDTETGGLNHYKSEVLQLSAILISANTGEVLASFNKYLMPTPGMEITDDALRVNGITKETLLNAEDRVAVYNEFLDLTDRVPLLGYNLAFDLRFIQQDLKRLGITRPFPTATTLDILPKVRGLRLPTTNNKLSTICEHLGYETKFHDSLNDCRATDFVFRKLFLERGELPTR